MIDKARRAQETARLTEDPEGNRGLRDARMGRHDNIARRARVRFIARIHH